MDEDKASILAQTLSQHGLTGEDCDRVISDRYLQKIASTHCEKWRSLYPYLKVPKIWVNDIDRSHPIGKEEEKRFTFFDKWKSMKKDEATYKALIVALLEINCQDDADGICGLVKRCNDSPESQHKITVEKPFHDKEVQHELYKIHKPDAPPKKGTDLHYKLRNFSKEVDIILQTVNRNEYQAATTFMKAPFEDFTKAVVFPINGMVVGFFAEKKVALIQSESGENSNKYIKDAIKFFPNAQYIIAVGACFSFKNLEHKLGDVIVSEKISELANMKFDSESKIINRGQIIEVAYKLKRIFCITVEHDPEFKVTQVRHSEVHEGTFVSHSFQIDDDKMRKAIQQAIPGAIGGEMEGGKLLGLMKFGKIEGVIVIKGIADNGDRNTAEEWQFTGTMAAVHYVESKLRFAPSFSISGSGSSAINSSTISSESTVSSMECYPPVKLRSNFPFLQLTEFPEDEIEQHLLDLYHETDIMKRKFQRLIFKLKQYIRANFTIEEVVEVLLDYDKNRFKMLLSDCNSVADVLDKISDHYSFYDYSVIKVLTQNLGSNANKTNLQKYKTRFREFWKRRICKIPSDALSDVKDEGEKFKVKLDKELGALTGDDIEKLKYEMRKTLKHNLQFLYAEEGCALLVFRDFDHSANISKEQQLALKGIDILSICYGQELPLKIGETDGSMHIDVREVADTGIYSELGTITSAVSEETESENMQLSQPSKSFTPHKSRDLQDARLDMIMSANLMSQESNYQTTADIDIITTRETKRKPLPHQTPLYKAITEGNIDEIKRLIEEGENPCDQDTNGDNALHYAAESGKLEILKYLIDEGMCIPAMKGWCGSTILHSAAAAKQISIVKYLVEECLLDPSTLEDDNRCSPLVYACRSGDINIAQYLIERMCETMSLTDIFDAPYYHKTSSKEVSVENVIDIDEFQRSPLTSACYYGDLPLVRYLVEKCNCDLFTKRAFHQVYDSTLYLTGKVRTPLESAVLGGHLHITEYLVKKMANVGGLSEANNNPLLHYATFNSDIAMVKFLTQKLSSDPSQLFIDSTPLHIAAQSGNLNVVKYFINDLKCDPDVKGYRGMQPIHFAAYKGHLDIVRFLLEEQSCSASDVDARHYTPLHYAAGYGHSDVVHYFRGVQVHSDTGSYEVFTPLHLAANKGHLDVVKYLITELNYDPNSQESGNDYAPLHSAAQDGHLKIVEYLVEEQNCDVNIKTLQYSTPLHIAAKNGHFEVVKYLAAQKNSDPNTADKSGSKPIHYASMGGNLDILKYFIENLNCDANSTDFYQNTPLHTAASNGHLDLVQHLITKQNCAVNLTGEKGYTPLHHAASNGHMNVVTYLVNQAKCEAGFNNTDLSIAPIHLAAIRGHLDVVQYLVEAKCDPNTPDEQKYGPIHYAAEGGHFTLVKYLVDQHKCDASSKTTLDTTPLSLAITNGHVNIVHYLVTESNCVPEFPPVHRAAKCGHLKLVKYLVEELKYDADSEDTFKRTPLVYAVAKDHLDVVKYLTTKWHCDYNAADKELLTPAHFAAQEGHLDLIKYLGSELKCDLNARTIYGDTPLHLATNKGHLDIVKYLTTEQKCDPNVKNADQVTPAHSAAANGYLSIMKYLLEEQSCDVNTETINGSTPLHYAADEGYFDIVEYLTSQLNCDPYAVDMKGLQPMHNATKNGHIDIVKYLAEKHSYSDNFFLTLLVMATTKGRLDVMKYLITKLKFDPRTPVDLKGSRLVHFTEDIETVKYLVEEQNCDPVSANFENVTPLHIAASSGNLDLVEYFISQQNCNPYTPGERGYTTLHFAAQHGNLNIVKHLVGELKCDANCAESKTLNHVFPLHLAATEGHIEVVHYLISEAKCDRNTPDSRGLTPIHYAAQGGHLNIVKYLVEQQNCDVNCKTLSSSTPLHLATSEGNIDIVRYLTTDLRCEPNCVDNTGFAPIHFAAEYGHLKILKYFVEELKCDANSRISSTNTAPLHLASLQGHLKIVRYLTTQLNCDPNSSGQNEYKPIHYAAIGRQFEVLKYLVQSLNCNPNSKAMYDATPVHLAANKGLLDVVKYLVTELKSDPNVLDSMGMAPIHLAAEEGHLKVVKYLVELNCDIYNKDVPSTTPVHLAAFEGHLNVVHYFTTQLKIDPSLPDDKGRKPIHYAAQRGQLNIVIFLVKILHCEANTKAIGGSTPLHIAARNGHLNLVKCLVSQLQCDPTLPNDDTLTSIHIAAKYGHLSIFKYLVEEQSCDANIMSTSSAVPLHLAAKKGHLDVVQYLTTTLKCNPNIQDKNEFMPIHYAARGGHLDILKYLVNELNCDATLKAVNISPLHLASQKGHLDVVRYLTTELNCNPNSIGERNFTAVHYAAEKGHLKIIEFLINELNCDANTTSSLYTPLQIAAREGYVTVVRYLVDKTLCDINANLPTRVIDTHDPNTNTEMKLLYESAASIETAIKELPYIMKGEKPASEEMSHEEQIIETTKTVAIATYTLVHSSIAAQQELIADDRINSDSRAEGAQPYDEILSAANEVAVLTTNLCASANALLQGEVTQLIPMAMAVSSSISQLSKANEGVTDVKNDKFQMVNDIVQKAVEAMVKAASVWTADKMTAGENVSPQEMDQQLNDRGSF